MKTIYKWIPYDIWEQSQYELWLKELAYSGLKIQKVGKYIGKFKKTTSQEMEYRLSFHSHKLEQAIITDYEWKEVEAAYDFRLYGSKCASARENLYKDRYRQIEDIVLKRRSHKKQIGGTVLCWIVILVMLLWPREYYALKLISQNYNLLGFLILTQIAVGYRQIRAYRGFKRLEEAIKEDRLKQQAIVKKINISRGIYLILAISVWITFFIQFKSIGNEKTSLPLEEIDLPIVQLIRLEEDSTLRRDPDDAKYNFYNYYEKYRTPLAFRVYKADEDGVMETKDYRDKHPNVETEFYELTFEGMREILVKDLIQRYQDKIKYPYKDIKKEDAQGLDGIYILDKDYRIDLIGIKDNRVMYVSYKGNAGVEKVIEEMARKIVY